MGLKKLKQKYEFDVDLAEALDALAKDEQRAPEALAADLLAQAVESKQQTVENIELWERLSPREKEVVALVCCGYMNKEIGILQEQMKKDLRSKVRKMAYDAGITESSDLMVLPKKIEEYALRFYVRAV